MFTIFRDFSHDKFKETQTQGTYYYEDGTRIHDNNKIHNFILIARNTDLLHIFDIHDIWVDVSHWFDDHENKKKKYILENNVVGIFGLALKSVGKDGFMTLSLVGGLLVVYGSGLDMIADTIHNRNVKIVRNFNDTVEGYVQIYPGVVSELERLKELYT